MKKRIDEECVRFSFRIPPSLMEDIDRYRDKENYYISRNSWILKTLKQYITQGDKKTIQDVEMSDS